MKKRTRPHVEGKTKDDKMQIRELVRKRRRDLNIAVSLIGVIPLLVLAYLLLAKVASIQILTGEIGLIMLCAVMIFCLGLIVGRKLFWSIIQELIEKHRLAAVTETALSLSHEINNPLLAMRGNLDFLEEGIKDADAELKHKLKTIKDGCERIQVATNKISNLSRPPVSDTIHGKAKMIDLNKSK